MKVAVNRPRPSGGPYSFPSGHTTSAFITAGVVQKHFGPYAGYPAFALAGYVGLSPNADVAWFSCLLDDMGEWDGQPVGWKDARWTGVLVKRDGIWLMNQEHFSLPTDAPSE